MGIITHHTRDTTLTSSPSIFFHRHLCAHLIQLRALHRRQLCAAPFA